VDVADALGLAHTPGRGEEIVELLVEDQVLDVLFLLVGQLEAVAAEDLEPVVLVGVVGGGNHDARIGAHALGDEGNPGGGQHADEVGMAPHGGDPGLEGALQHVSREAGVLPDDDPGAVPVFP